MTLPRACQRTHLHTHVFFAAAWRSVFSTRTRYRAFGPLSSLPPAPGPLHESLKILTLELYSPSCRLHRHDTHACPSWLGSFTGRRVRMSIRHKKKWLSVLLSYPIPTCPMSGACPMDALQPLYWRGARGYISYGIYEGLLCCLTLTAPPSFFKHVSAGVFFSISSKKREKKR